MCTLVKKSLFFNFEKGCNIHFSFYFIDKKNNRFLILCVELNKFPGDLNTCIYTEFSQQTDSS